MRSSSTATLIPDGALPDSLLDHHRLLLVRVADDGDRDAFKTLFLHFGPRIKALMMKAGADPELAEDLVQDVMMTVWRKARLYAPERGAVSTWIYTIARNARIDRLRRGTARPYEDLDAVQLASEEADGEDEAFASQRAEHVAEALADLPDEQRRIIELAYVEDLSQSDIAAKLDIPLGTVKSRMRLAYGKLKTRLEGLQ